MAQERVGREIARHAGTFGDQIEVDPARAILAVVYATAGHMAWLSSRIQLFEEDGLASDPKVRTYLALYGQERDRLVRYSKVAIDAGVSSEVVRMTRARAEATTYALMEAVKAIGLDRQEAERFVAAYDAAMKEIDGLKPAEVTRRFELSRATFDPDPSPRRRRPKVKTKAIGGGRSQ